MRQITRTCGRLLVLGALFAAPVAWADIQDVSPVPPSGTVALGRSNTLTVNWNVTRAAGGSCGPTVSSAQGELYAGNLNGPLLLTVPTTLSQTTPCANSPTFFSFSETIVIPAGVVRRAQEQGFSNLVYTRTFSDGVGIPDSGSVTLSITSPAAGALNVQRQALSFDNGAPAAVLGRDDALGAVTELTFTGTGLLRAQWEVAGPESTSGTPVFRTISQIRQYLAGGDTQVLRSPTLPTATTGLYFLRLRIIDPEPGFDPPVIRYFVLQDRDERPPGARLSLGAPAPRALLASDTVFAWEALPGARAYQLEIYGGREDSGLALPDLRSQIGEPAPSEVALALARAPVTGTLVPGGQTRAVLSPVARRHLLSGRRYFWRVLAIGEDGRIIGVSPVRELRTP